MLNIPFAFVLALVTPAFAQPTDSRLAPPPAKSDNRPVQHGAQPNPQEVRPGSPQGDAPSAAVGTLERDRRPPTARRPAGDRKSTRLNSSHSQISYAVFCLKKKKKQLIVTT